MSDDPRKHREVQALLRNISAMVLLMLFSVIVIASVLSPLVSSRRVDTALLLGLASAIIGAMPVLLGIQIALTKKRDE